MTDDAQPETSLSDLLTEYNRISAQADELRQKMKELTRRIEARASAPPVVGGSSDGNDVPNVPNRPIQS